MADDDKYIDEKKRVKPLFLSQSLIVMAIKLVSFQMKHVSSPSFTSFWGFLGISAIWFFPA